MLCQGWVYAVINYAQMHYLGLNMSIGFYLYFSLFWSGCVTVVSEYGVIGHDTHVCIHVYPGVY